jgi:alpha-1,2-mannosyltransferase
MTIALSEYVVEFRGSRSNPLEVQAKLTVNSCAWGALWKYMPDTAPFSVPDAEHLCVNSTVSFNIIDHHCEAFPAPASRRLAIATAGLFTLIGFVSVSAAGLWMIKLAALKGHDRLVLLFLMTTNGPLIYTLKEGNTSQFVLLGLVAALWLLRKRRQWAAGALLAAMALIKLPLLLFGPYLLFRRNWPAVAGFVVVCGFAGVLSVAIFGWDMHVVWFDNAVLRFRDHTLSAYNTQSVQSFLLRLREPPPPLINWTTSEVSTTQRHVGLLLTGFLYLVAVLACIKGSRSHGYFCSENEHARWDTEYVLVLCLAVVSSPLSWSHYYCWLLLPTALFLGSQPILTSSPLVNWLRWTGTIMVMPVVVGLQFSDPIVLSYYTKFGVSSYLIGGLIWFSTLVWSLVSRPTPSLTKEECVIAVR